MPTVAYLCERCRWVLARWVTVGADGTRALVCAGCGHIHNQRPEGR